MSAIGKFIPKSGAECRYDLFLALMNEKASRSLLACRDFAAFKALARSAP
ncbi:hypothetical protein JD474_18840 [Aeromonas caviae]|nr:hypothetical protein [Aeromonas caviae]